MSDMFLSEEGVRPEKVHAEDRGKTYNLTLLGRKWRRVSQKVENSSFTTLKNSKKLRT